MVQSCVIQLDGKCSTPKAGTASISRRLARYDSNGNFQEITDAELRERAPPLVVIGDPGWATFVLKSLGGSDRGEFVRASTFVANPAKFRPASPDNFLIIDALDEVAALREGDPLYNVLSALGSIDYPPFVLSCRAADWRGATARIDISDHYDQVPEQWTLQPISRDEAHAFLEGLGVDVSRSTLLLDRLEERSLSDLYGNPLTLGLLSKLALGDDDSVPSGKAALFERAVDILRTEHNPGKHSAALAKLSKSEALDAAGAIMASLLLSGKDAVTTVSKPEETYSFVTTPDIATLPGGNAADAVIASRLFRTADFDDQAFVPLHRTIAEYLGARWLGERASSDELRITRILKLMSADGLVPASLRGLHAWLAQTPSFTLPVIESDPYGFLRYGDADNLSSEQARVLLRSLGKLNDEDPFFRADDWTPTLHPKPDQPRIAARSRRSNSQQTNRVPAPQSFA